MCGRYGLTTAPTRIARLLRTAYDETGFRPHFNIAPTQPVLAALNGAERSVAELRWGLVPWWSHGPQSVKLSTFNARIETVATAPAYRDAFAERRCAIFADGYYEWRREPDGSKTPMWIYREDREPFAFAGVWDRWRAPGSDERLRSCTIITQPPNAFAERIHSRMPVVLDVERANAWLEHGKRDARSLMQLLEPTPSAEWAAYAVGRRVGNVRFDDASLIAPLSS